jgi:radical SAM superfamily enzyme YgiQ (UPF0313 family)
MEKDVDFVVRGEGEVTICELASHLAEGRKDYDTIDGLSYKHQGEIMQNRSRELINELDEIPYPRRDLMINYVSSSSFFKNLMGSRGCPYNCSYCSSTQFWTRKMRYRSVSNIIGEIKHLKERYGVTELEFWDDSFTVNKKKTKELCEKIISEKLNISWWCNTRADLVDEEILKFMKAAGCTKINIGVETGSEETLSYLNRQLTFKDIMGASKLLAECSIDWDAYFIIGFPYETRESIEETRKLMYSLSATGVSFSVFNPYPGTELYNICRKEGLVNERMDWSNFSHQSPENHFVKNIPREEFRKIVRDISEEFDNLNTSFSSSVRRLLSKRHYYYKNPSEFVKKMKRKVRNNL